MWDTKPATTLRGQLALVLFWTVLFGLAVLA